MKEIAKALGRALRMRRAELGMSAKELTEKTGIGAPQLSQIESGAKLSQKNLPALLDALGVEFDCRRMLREKASEKWPPKAINSPFND